jgi:hypothetical protein
MILITILTCIVYLIANSFSYKIGTDLLEQSPLYDILHEILPNLAKYVYIRDVILILMILPIIFFPKLWEYIPELWNSFMLVVLVKAICIFFTNIPSSHPSCHNPNLYDMNNCFHSAVSGHVSLFVILALLYIKGGFNVWIIWLSVLLYSILIVMSRAHYTLDVIQGVLITFLIAN